MYSINVHFRIIKHLPEKTNVEMISMIIEFYYIFYNSSVVIIITAVFVNINGMRELNI